MSVTTVTRKGLTYWLGSTLYLSVTNRSNSLTLLESRGPGFSMPKESEFEPLDDSKDEPRAEEFFSAVDDVYEHDQRKVNVGMGEMDPGIVFAGAGEPMLRLDAVLEAAALIKEVRHGVPMRLNTNGLVSNPEETIQDLQQVGIKHVSVLFPVGTPDAYERVMKPQDGLGFGNACSFVAACAEAGLTVTCTGIGSEGLKKDTAEARALATALGAVEFKVRSYYP